MTPTLHLVDDDDGFRTALARLLRALGHEVKEYPDAQAFLAATPTGAGCILLDVYMPGLSGLGLQALLAERGVTLPIIFITGHGDIPMGVHAMRAGAEDFLTKPVGRAALSQAITRALERNARERTAAQAQRQDEERLARLSPRETQVARLLAQGLLNKQVAFELGTTERTVKAHRASLMDKLGIRSVAELARLLDRAAPP